MITVVEELRINNILIYNILILVGPVTLISFIIAVSYLMLHRKKNFKQKKAPEKIREIKQKQREPMKNKKDLEEMEIRELEKDIKKIRLGEDIDIKEFSNILKEK